ncbi:MAG: hypothetical protein ACXQTI_03460, partial [Candidatus Nezhaarchaeales archaeon]
MKKVIEVLCPILLFSSYLKLVSLSGVASIFMIHRWSMVRPLSIVFVNDFVDCLVVALVALAISILLAYRHRTSTSFLFIILSLLSVIFSISALYLYSVSLSLLVGFLTLIYASLLKK